MEFLWCEQRLAKVSLVEILRCFEHPLSEDQAWAVCFQCCCKMKQLAQGLCPPLHSVFINGPESIFIHADGTASFMVYHESDVGSIQQSEDKLLEYLGMVIYEALDWGISDQVERELSDPLEKLLYLMLKLDDGAMKPAVTLQDVIKSLRKMDGEGVVEKSLQKKDKHWVIEQKHRTPKADVAVPKPHLKPVLERKLKEHMPQKSNWREQLMVEVKQPQKLQSAAAGENGSRPKEMIVTPNAALKSPSNSFQTLQDDSTGFKIVDTTRQQLEPGVQETTLKLPSSSWLASTRSAVVSSNSAGLAASCICPPVSAHTLGDIKPNGFLNAGQMQLPPYRGRSKSVERGLQSKELDCPFPTKWPTPTIAELIGTRYAMMVLEGQDFFQGGSDGIFPRAKICFSCHKQMFLKWPYSCYLCSSVVCCDCCVKMSLPLRTCVHLPLHFLKLLRLSREEDPAAQEQKSLELLHEIVHWKYFGVPVTLEPRCLARPLCCYTGPVADWLTADICRRCEQYLLNMASSQQQSIPLRRTSCP
ncbi:protein spire homolog 1-like isoform X10 [Lathamus discolor]|uniref:protein spire homolog 1-like isoform X10 n=1 Tax=Lathamus discolor TaxID=678569 RepID=UPI0032B8700C